jgi:hypothetical protein
MPRQFVNHVRLAIYDLGSKPVVVTWEDAWPPAGLVWLGCCPSTGRHCRPGPTADLALAAGAFTHRTANHHEAARRAT